MPNSLFKIVLAFVLSFVMSYLIRSGELLNYVAPKMIIYFQIAMVLLFVIAIVNLYIYYNPKPTVVCHDCNHDQPKSKYSHLIVIALFLVPILLAAVTPNRVVVNKLIDAKGIKNPTDLSQAMAQTEAPEGYSNLGKRLYSKPTVVISDDGFVELLTAIGLYEDMFVGKKIEMSGTVYREEGMSRNEWMVSRLVMSCCSADATPYGIVMHSADAAKYADNSWVKVTGVIRLSKDNQLYIAPTKVEPMTPPKNIYLLAYSGNLADLPFH